MTALKGPLVESRHLALCEGVGGPSGKGWNFGIYRRLCVPRLSLIRSLYLCTYFVRAFALEFISLTQIAYPTATNNRLGTTKLRQGSQTAGQPKMSKHQREPNSLP